MKPKKLSHEWLYCLVTSREFFERFASMVTGTSGSHQRVKPESLGAMLIIVPDKSVGKLFTEAAAPLLERAGHCQDESSTLGSLRDTLLPKLISGELRIRDAKRVVEQAV